MADSDVVVATTRVRSMQLNDLNFLLPEETGTLTREQYYRLRGEDLTTPTEETS